MSPVAAYITSRAPSRWSGPFPSVEGALKGVDLLVAKQERDLPHAEARAREQASCRLMPNIVEEVLIRCAKLAEAALHRARAHS